MSSTEKNFNLLKSLIKQNERVENLEILNNVEKIINTDLPNVIKKNAPVNFQEIYFDFKYEYDKFKEFMIYEELIGKNVVALGGGFSSGKSTFLNSLLEKKFLPSKIDPSTSVPTYIVNGQAENVYGINIFNNKVDLTLKDLKKIAHGFGEEFDEDDNITGDEVKLGHILNSIFLSTENQVYNHIAFLDTPGYSKQDTNDYSSKTDEKIARAQLNSSNFILWFIQADDGTIRQDDIDFLKTIKPEIPKLIIINKCDKLNVDDVYDVKSKVRELLDIKGINYIDVVGYSSRKKEEYDSDKIKSYLDDWNKKVYESTFARNFKVLFVKCKKYYDELTDIENRRLNRINSALTMSDNSVVNECLNSLVSEIKRNLLDIKEITNKLKVLQNDFFTEIKKISDIVGISMPEPSEIDLLDGNYKNPLEMVKEYKKKNGIKSDDKLYLKLFDELNSVNCEFNKSAGGTEYKNEILDLLIKEL